MDVATQAVAHYTISTCMYPCMYVCLYVCVCIYVCVSVCVYVSMYVRMCPADCTALAYRPSVGSCSVRVLQLILPLCGRGLSFRRLDLVTEELLKGGDHIFWRAALNDLADLGAREAHRSQLRQRPDTGKDYINIGPLKLLAHAGHSPIDHHSRVCGRTLH